MSGSTDTSTYAQRHAFLQLIESGGGAGISPNAQTLAAAVANSPAVIPDTAGFLLDLPSGSTYAQAAAQCQQRWAAGRAAF